MINYNGKLISDQQAIFTAANRSFQYGDGCFESIRMLNGKMPFLDLHIKRLEATLDYLQIRNPGQQTPDFWYSQIQKIPFDNNNQRIRIRVFRAPGGLYQPTDNQAEFVIESKTLDQSHYKQFSRGLHIDVYPEPIVNPHRLSNFKTNNRLPYVLASIFKAEHQFDDVLVLNSQYEIAEASSSNLFIVKANKVITPPLTSGCLDGVMRQVVMQLCRKINLKIIEQNINTKTVEAADEIWLTNAVKGIQWVKQFNNCTFTHLQYQIITDQLNQRINEKNSGC